MTSAVNQATALKNDGNKAFAAHNWLKAVELYTKAIELNNKEPTFYTNRAQVCTPNLWRIAAILAAICITVSGGRVTDFERL
jgi:hypothetical protein